jgi:thiol-disulfide isomerase/thioredoxin
MSLMILSTEDFFLRHENGVNVLTHPISGISILLFYSKQCRHCQFILPTFYSFPEKISGCIFGLVNISINKSLAITSQQTNTPIQYVPLIILYVNGRPFKKYSGPLDEQNIRAFILHSSAEIHESGFTKKVNKKGIPEYSLGVPITENVSYLEFDGMNYKSVKKDF